MVTMRLSSVIAVLWMLMPGCFRGVTAFLQHFPSPRFVQQARAVRWSSAATECSELSADELSSLDSVPKSFGQCITDAATATASAIADGKMLLEVEFPPLATDVLELPECSAYDVSKANVRLSVDFAAKFAQRGTRVAIMLPDTAEMNRGNIRLFV